MKLTFNIVKQTDFDAIKKLAELYHERTKALNDLRIAEEQLNVMNRIYNSKRMDYEKAFNAFELGPVLLANIDMPVPDKEEPLNEQFNLLEVDK